MALQYILRGTLRASQLRAQFRLYQGFARKAASL